MPGGMPLPATALKLPLAPPPFQCVELTAAVCGRGSSPALPRRGPTLGRTIVATSRTEPPQTRACHRLGTHGCGVTREEVRVMRRIRWLMALALLVAPEMSHAIQLHWWSGATNLDFTEATRCTLVVQADSAETALPSEWRLLWVADTSAVQFTALDSVLACQADTAQVSQIEGPSTSADSAANLTTAHFCSGGANGASAATYLVDLPGNAHGKLKAVALDPADSSQVIESNEVTFNGGIEASYQPLISSVSRSHDSERYVVQARGQSLSAVRQVAIVAPDGSWSRPLVIEEQTDSTLTASNNIVAPVPSCMLQASAGESPLLALPLPADNVAAPMTPDTGRMTPGGSIQPKDFAFIYVPSQKQFHIFYIRHDMNLTGGGETCFGHATSSDLITATISC
jgi:hypothetical protein